VRRRRARPKAADTWPGAAQVRRRVRQRRENVRVHVEQQQRQGWHYDFGLQPVRFPAEQQFHGAGTGHMFLQLDNGLVHRRRQGRWRGLVVVAVPPGTDAVRHRIGYRR